MKRAVVNVLLCVALVFFVLSSSFVVTAQSQRESATNNQQILILSGPQYGLPISNTITAAMVDTFVLAGVSLDDIYVEFLDLHRISGDQHRLNLLSSLTKKLEGEQIGLIIAVNRGAVDFVLQNGQDLFPDAPMLIPIYEDDDPLPDTSRHIIQLSSAQDAKGTLKYALDLFPDTRRVVIMMGKDDTRAPFYANIIEALDAWPIELDVEDTSDLTYEEMLVHVSSLPDDTIGIYGSYFEDVTNQSYVPAEVASQIAKTANVPVFALRDVHVMYGLLGGSVTLTSDLGELAATTALDFFAGTLALSGKKTVIDVSTVPLFDWEQLQRWEADPKILPDDTIYINFAPTLWDMYSDLLIIAGVFVLTLLFLVVLLPVANRRQKITLDRLNKSEGNLLRAYDETIKGWGYAVDLKDKETEQHSVRVTQLTLHLAERLGVKKEDLLHVRRGALLHDIGKMGIPDSILQKPGKLTDEEWNVIRKHPVYAYEMLSPIDYLDRALDIPYGHHEKWDGSGYPRGLKGSQIPLSARIFAVVDVYDALTSDRPYRKAWTKKQALDYIKEQRGRHFDPAVVDAFMEDIEDFI